MTSASSPPKPTPSPFPTPSKQHTLTLPPHNTPTSILILPFTDKILITITQAGRLSQWVQVPLSSDLTNPAQADTYLPSFSDGGGGSDLLPLPHLTPTTILGAAGSQRETWARLVAGQVASAIKTQNPEEGRCLVVGLGVDFEGLQSAEGSRDEDGDGDGEGQGGREGWMDLVEGVVGCLGP